MGTILFECPKTGRAVSTGIETQPISFCRLTETCLNVYCPLCGHFHEAKVWLAEETSSSLRRSASDKSIERKLLNIQNAPR
jgi:hypothetical protein